MKMKCTFSIDETILDVFWQVCKEEKLKQSAVIQDLISNFLTETKCDIAEQFIDHSLTSQSDKR